MADTLRYFCGYIAYVGAMTLQTRTSSSPHRLKTLRPHWKSRPVVLALCLATGLTALLVFTIGHKSFLVESEITVAIVAAGLFMLLAAGLYRGVHVPEEETSTDQSANWEWTDAVPELEVPDCGDGLAGLALGILVWILLIAAAFLLAEVLPIVFVAVFWLFNRALRQVFKHGEDCHCNLARSLLYALGYTFLYTGWLFALLFVLQRFGR